MTIRAFLLCTFIAVGGLATGQSDDPAARYIGKPFPDFKMKTLEGKTLTKKSLRGKVIVVDFWASWCGPCRMAMPSLERLSRAYKKKGLVVIGANTSEQGGSDPVTVNTIRKQGLLTYTFTLDNDKLADKLAIDGLPSIFFVDRKGVIRNLLSGTFRDPEMEYRHLESAVKPLLAAKK